ncbi:hypothetical protein [Nocardioides sp. PD653-B2]|uniref:hypothetical protein n=1 Tax=Nocardioides sp. PD653-B2 TaxID=1892811 RepID=UPI001054ECCF|nr:hypothetical protein [Nocardioides sp. PD653-B2]
MWTAETGGSQVTDLMLGGVPVTSIPVGTNGAVPTFQGPDGVYSLWADGGSDRSRLDAVGSILEAAAGVTDGLLTAVDADPESDFRTQQDARLNASTEAIVNELVPAATAFVKGKIQIATLAEVATGTAADKAVAPDTLLAIAGRAMQASDHFLYVSRSSKASDSNDGLSPGTAKATTAAAIAALPSGGGVVFHLYGTWNLGSGSVGLTIAPGKPVMLMGLAQRGFTEFTYSGTGVAVKVGDGRMVTDLVLTNGSTTATSATANFTAADTGKVMFAQYVNADVTMTYVDPTTVTLSAPAQANATGVTAWISTRCEGLFWAKYLQITCTHATAATTGILMTDIHGGFIEDVRVLGSSYNVGSYGIRSVNGYVFYYNRLVVQSFETGMFLDGFCNESSITDTNVGAKVVCVLVKNSTNVRVRGGQLSTTGIGAGGVGFMAIVTGFGNPGGDPVGAGAGLQLDNIHFEGNTVDIAIGRAADGSTYPVRSPSIRCYLPSGAVIDRATSPVLHNVTLYGTAVLSLTANCIDPQFVGEPSLRDTATIADSSTRTRPRDRDVLDILAARVPLRPWLVGDAFARADAAGSLGTSDSGLAWTNTSGTWNLTSRAAVPAGAANNIATVDVGTADHWVTVEIGTSPATVAQWPIARLVDASNMYRIGIFPTSVTLQKVVAGAATTLLTLTQTPAAGDTLGLRCSGTSLIVYRNGFIIGRATDSALSGTRAGIKADATTAIFRNFRVKTS